MSGSQGSMGAGCSTWKLDLVDAGNLDAAFFRIVEVSQAHGTVKISIVGDFLPDGSDTYTVVGPVNPA